MSRFDDPFFTSFHATRRLAYPARVAALGAALRVARGETAERLALELLTLAALPSFVSPPKEVADRDQFRWITWLGEKFSKGRRRRADHALAEVGKLWIYVPLHLRPLAVATGRGRWAGVAGIVEPGDPVWVRHSAAELAGDAREAALAPLAARLAGDAEPGVARAAQRSLLMLAVACARMGLPASALAEPADSPSAIDRALDEGLEGPEGAVAGAIAAAACDTPCRPVMLSMLVLLDPAALLKARRGLAGWREAAAALADAAHPGHEGLRAALRLSTSALARLRAFEWLARPEVSRRALERCMRAATFAEHELILSRAHLAARPARAARLSSAPPAKGMGRDAPLPARPLVPRLSAQARRGLPLFAGALRMDDRMRAVALEPLLADADPAVRHSLARRTPGALAFDLALDPDARVARTAMLAWGGDRGREGEPERSRQALLLTRSPHATVRHWAGRSADVRGRGVPDSSEALLWWRRRLERDPGGVVDELGRGIETGAGEACVRAMMCLRRMGLHAHARDRLINVVAAGRDAACVATAVATLGELRSPEAEQVLADALGADDARVRANAVEALGGRGGVGAPWAGRLADIKPLQDDPHHRVRANALRALIAGSPEAGPEGAGSLGTMLTDSRPMHRLAGVWAAQRTMTGRGRSRFGGRWAEIAALVDELAARDPEERVRLRARACSTRLNAETAITGAGAAR